MGEQYLDVDELPEDSSDVVEFRDDDDGYAAWIPAHPDAYVVNIQRSYNPSDARLHHAGCWTISPERLSRGAATHQYVKVCASLLGELDEWAVNQVGHPIRRCGVCHPATATTRSTSVAPQDAPRSSVDPNARHAIDGSSPQLCVQAWADDYIRFERRHRPPWQARLRDDIRHRCNMLRPAAEQVLHATFFGPKHPQGDIENVLLYYIGSFKNPGANGIRFEHGAGPLPAPNGEVYQYGYRYTLAPRSDTFAHWQRERTLATFDWTDLGPLVGEKKPAPVWLGLARGQVSLLRHSEPGTTFAVQLEMSPPPGHQPVWGDLVKPVFDGVVAAFQSQTDTAELGEVCGRLERTIPAGPVEIERHLLDQRRAVLGVTRRLVAPFRGGVKWDPCDHLCVAGELLAGEPGRSTSGGWAVRGEVFEVARPPQS